jgi:hypothetical protein
MIECDHHGAVQDQGRIEQNLVHAPNALQKHWRGRTAIAIADGI